MTDQIYFGTAVKDLGNGKVGGYLVVFGSPTDPDLTGDYFTKSTDFDLERSNKTTIYYNHALDGTMKSRKLGTGELKVDDVGVFVEAQLELRDEYEKAIYGMAQKGKLGWSSGTASHLVERESKGSAFWIKAWALGLDASLTPTPAEPKTLAIPLKSWATECKSFKSVKQLFDPLADVDDTLCYQGLMALRDCFWDAIYQTVWNEDDSIEDRIALYQQTCDGIRDKGTDLLKQLATIEATETEELKNAVKSALSLVKASEVKDIRTYEKFLRDSGFPKGFATTLASKGWLCRSESEGQEAENNSTKIDLKDFCGLLEMELSLQEE